MGRVTELELAVEAAAKQGWSINADTAVKLLELCAELRQQEQATRTAYQHEVQERICARDGWAECIADRVKLREQMFDLQKEYVRLQEKWRQTLGYDTPEVFEGWTQRNLELYAQMNPPEMFDAMLQHEKEVAQWEARWDRIPFDSLHYLAEYGDFRDTVGLCIAAQDLDAWLKQETTQTLDEQGGSEISGTAPSRTETISIALGTV
jgi:hypothetical protein